MLYFGRLRPEQNVKDFCKLCEHPIPFESCSMVRGKYLDIPSTDVTHEHVLPSLTLQDNNHQHHVEV